MRITAPLFALLLSLPLTGEAQAQTQDPAAQQDAEAAREKLLNAADQLDNIQANSEATKLAVETMKADMTKLQADVQALQTENATLKQQLADLQTALDRSEAARLKDRQALIDNVADMLAKNGGSPHPAKKKPSPASDPSDPPAADPPPVKTSAKPAAPNPGDRASVDPSLTPPPEPTTSTNNDGYSTITDRTFAGSQPLDGTPAAPTWPNNTPKPSAPKPQKGYYHVIAEGETLTLICNAYRDHGVNVTVAQIRKANGLTESSVLKPGQRIFIPKPGT